MNIYVVGNIAVDDTWRCSVLPEKGTSVSGDKTSQDIGGKGANQAIILARCGLPVTLIAGRGYDSYGQWMKETLARENITFYPAEPLTSHSDASVIFNTDDGDNAIVTTRSAASALSAEMIIDHLSDARPGDIFLQQGNFSAEKTTALFRFARKKQLLTVFNPSPVDPDFAALWPLVDIAVVNQHEAELLKPDPQHCIVIVTRGAAGAELWSGDLRIPIEASPVKPVDPTGAGDTFLAVALASSVLRGCQPDRLALLHASRAAAITVSRQGTHQSFPDAASLAMLLSQPQ